MAEIAFRYVKGHSLVHRSDPRLKLLSLLSLSILCMYLDSYGVGALLVIIIIGLRLMGVGVPRLLRELRGFAVLFLLIILVKSWDFQTGGSGGYIVVWNPVGFWDGVLYVGKMAWIVGASVAFTVSTKSVEIRDAITWIFYRIPFVPAVRVATMFTLSCTLPAHGFEISSPLSLPTRSSRHCVWTDLPTHLPRESQDQSCLPSSAS